MGLGGSERRFIGYLIFPWEVIEGGKGQGRDTSPAKSHYTHFIDCQLIICKVILPVRFLITGPGEHLRIYCSDSQYLIAKSTLRFKDANLVREASG